MVVNGYVDMHCPFVCVSDKNMHDARRCRHCIVKRICLCANPPTWICPERGSDLVQAERLRMRSRLGVYGHYAREVKDAC